MASNLLGANTPSGRWLDIKISKKHWTIDRNLPLLEGREAAAEHLAHQVFVKVSEFLDHNAWATPHEAVQWLRANIRGTFYIGHVAVEES